MTVKSSKNDGAIEEIIAKMMETAGGIRRPEYVREMILSALKAGQEDDGGADIKLMNTTFKEMRFTARVFHPYRNIRKVTVFGSARMKPGDPLYEMARRFGQKLAEAGFMAITGGGGGIMQAINEGAGPDRSFGVNIRLPFKQKPNPVLAGNPRLITYKYFFNRKIAFLKEADAVALFPGGFGTLDEAMETLTLVQTGKRNPLPLLLVDDPSGSHWEPLIRLFREELLTRDFISPSDFALFERVCSVDAAVDKIRHFYRRYHSMRYVNGQLVIRMLMPLNINDIDYLNNEYRSLLQPGGRIAASPALDEERDDLDVIDLPRLLVDFNRMDFGGLRRLIDSINDR